MNPFIFSLSASTQFRIKADAGFIEYSVLRAYISGTAQRGSHPFLSPYGHSHLWVVLPIWKWSYLPIDILLPKVDRTVSLCKRGLKRGLSMDREFLERVRNIYDYREGLRS
jgi:hypothetical protein